MAGTPNGAAVGQALSGQAALHATVSAAMNAAAVAGNPLLAPGASVSMSGHGTLHVPVVQAFSAEGTWSHMGLTGGHNINLKRKAPRELDAHAGVGILNQVVATQRRKESHNATEQKRRQRINEKMKELQQLLPGSDPNADKATVLNAAIDHIKRLQAESDQLAAKKQALERQNQELQEENEQLARGASLPPKKQAAQDSALTA